MRTLSSHYQIKLPVFEGPFDLLLFFIQRDELDIKDIPIAKVLEDFLTYTRSMEDLDIPLASEFILFIAVLMQIKAQLILPRREKDSQGEEIDPRAAMVAQLLRYKECKDAALSLSKLEATRQLHIARGNAHAEMLAVAKEEAEGTPMENLSIYHLHRAFEKVLRRQFEAHNKPRHIVFTSTYTMASARKRILEKLYASPVPLSFHAAFETCENVMQALFFFLSILELVQEKIIHIITGIGRNNFILQALPLKT